MGIIKTLKQKTRSNRMEKFLRENEILYTNAFTAVGEKECPTGSPCEGYKLEGEYKLGSAETATITSPEGAQMLVIDFNLQLAEVKPEHTYEIAFGFEN